MRSLYNPNRWNLTHWAYSAVSSLYIATFLVWPGDNAGGIIHRRVHSALHRLERYMEELIPMGYMYVPPHLFVGAFIHDTCIRLQHFMAL